MNFYTLAAREERCLRRHLDELRSMQYDDENAREIAEARLDRQFEVTYRRAVRRMLMAKEINTEMGLTQSSVTRTYFITVRPTQGVHFEHFYELVYNYINRSCVENYTLSFEQKGLVEETLGTGYHVHIIAKMKQRSKGEVLRDTISSFQSVAEPQGVQVDCCKTPTCVIQKYLVGYESNDGHKILTKDADTLWRASMHLRPLYENNLPRRIQEVEPNGPYQVRTGPLLVEF